MSFTADIYKEICTDIAKNSRPNSIYAMRMLKLSNGINIAFSINTLTYMRGAFFSVDARATANQFPRAAARLWVAASRPAPTWPAPEFVPTAPGDCPAAPI